jgi:hypothetical protein
MPIIAPSTTTTFPSRAPVRLGSSIPWRALDWVTQTWLRFNILVAWVAVVLIIGCSPAPIGEKLGMFLVSPIAMIIIFPIWVVAIIVLSFMPGIRVPIGFMRILYFRTFSRYVVQPIQVSTPVWL